MSDSWRADKLFDILRQSLANKLDAGSFNQKTPYEVFIQRLGIILAPFAFIFNILMCKLTEIVTTEIVNSNSILFEFSIQFNFGLKNKNKFKF